MKTGKLYEGTWLGARGTTQSINANTVSLGLRAVIHEWIDKAEAQDVEYEAGTITVRIVKGDAWRRPDDFVLFHLKVFPPGTDYTDAMAYAIEKLSERMAA